MSVPGEFDVDVFPCTLWFTFVFGLSAGIHLIPTLFITCFLGTHHPFSSAKQASSLASFNAARLQQHEEDATVTTVGDFRSFFVVFRDVRFYGVLL